MRILALSSWWPEPADNGIRLRIAHLLRAMAEEHEVHLVAMSQTDVTPDQQQKLAQVCASIYTQPMQVATPGRAAVFASLWLSDPASVRATWNLAFEQLVRERAAAVQPDVVVAFELATAPYTHAIVGVPKVLDALEVSSILEQYTLHSHGWRRWRTWLTWKKHCDYVGRTLREFDACTVPSPLELAQIQMLAPASMPLAVVPNGADVTSYIGSVGTPEPDTLIYPGALSFSANYDAMDWFVHTSFALIKAKRPNTRLRITGKATTEQRASLQNIDGVEFTGYVPDVRPLVAGSWCEVVPLRVGGGTRLKILEALALGTPVISTTKGIEGLELEHNQHVLVANTPGEFVETTIQLLGDPDLRARLSAAGRQVVQAKYDWRMIGRQLNDLLCAAVARSPRAHRLMMEPK